MRFRVTHTVAIIYAIFFIALGAILHSYFFQDKEYHPPKDIVTFAKQYLNVPYRYGGSTPSGFDCSGFTMFLFQQYGKELPRTADQQAMMGTQIKFECIQPGNLVFFATTDEPTITHTGLYIGDHKFIHASTTAKKIIISNLDEPYWKKTFREARQILP